MGFSAGVAKVVGRLVAGAGLTTECALAPETNTVASADKTDSLFAADVTPRLSLVRCSLAPETKTIAFADKVVAATLLCGSGQVVVGCTHVPGREAQAFTDRADVEIGGLVSGMTKRSAGTRNKGCCIRREASWSSF